MPMRLRRGALGTLEALGGHRLCRCGFAEEALGALGALGGGWFAALQQRLRR